MPVITILLGLGLFALLFFYVFMYSSLFHMAGRDDGILLFGVVMGSLISFITTLSRANAYLFESKDYDLLMSLPVKPQVVIASKLSGLLILNYVGFGFFFLSTLITYGIYVNPPIWVYLAGLLVMLLGPLLIVTVCSFIAYFMGLLFAKMKHKNIFQTIFIMVIFFVFFLSMMSYSMAMGAGEDDVQELINMINSLITMFERMYYPGTLAVSGIFGNIQDLLLYVGISIIPFAFFVWIVGRYFHKANARARIAYTDKNFKLKEQESQSQVAALVKKEVRRYFSSSMVVMNTIVGPIMGTIFVFALVFGQSSFIDEFQLVGVDRDLMVLILIGMSTFMNGIISTTASSISLEGKYFWVLKSAPLNERDVFTSKVLLNFLITIPFTIINTIVIMIAFGFNLRDCIMLLFIPIAINLIMGTFGLYINLLVPKMDWDQEVKVVKQSLSVVLVMLVGMGFITGMIFLSIFLVSSFGLDWMYILLSVILLVFLSLSIFILETHGKKLYRRLKA